MLAEEFAAFKHIYEFSKTRADEVRFGTGSYGSFSPIFATLSAKSLFTLGADKRLSFNFEWIANDNERAAETFKEKLETAGFKFPDVGTSFFPGRFEFSDGDKSSRYGVCRASLVAINPRGFLANWAPHILGKTVRR